MKILFIDTETTGLDVLQHDIVQIGAALWIDGVMVEMINLFCQPTKWNTISAKALEINHNTIESLKSYPLPKVAYTKIYESLIKYGDEMWLLGGQNAKGFDNRFLEAFFNQHMEPNHRKWGDMIDIDNNIDLMDISKPLKNCGRLKIPNTKLGTVAESVGVVPEGELHNALTDIVLTIKTIEKTSRIFADWINEDATALNQLSPGLNRMYREFGLIG